MTIVIDEITNDLSLITDFCEKGDEEETRLYWDNLIENLQIKLGATFNLSTQVKKIDN